MKKFEKITLLFLAILMIFTNLPNYSFIQAESDVKNSGYQFDVEYNENNTSAKIVGNNEKVPENVTIDSITTEDEQTVDLENPVLNVDKNGQYEFHIAYTVHSADADNNPIQTELNEELTVEVNDLTIKEEKINESSEKIEIEEKAKDEIEDLTSKESEGLTLETDDAFEKNIYNLNLSANMMSGADSYVIELIMPEGVKIHDSFNSDYVESVKKIGTTTTIKIKNSSINGNPTHLGLSIPIDQVEYFNNTTQEIYQIRGSYKKGSQVIASDTVDVKAGSYLKLSNVEYVSSETTLINEWQIKELKLVFHKGLDVAKLQNKITFSIQKDDQLEYDVTNQGWKDVGNRYEITFDKSEIVSNENEKYVVLPFKARIKNDILSEIYKRVL